jgi:hypothetical protein
MKKYLLLAILFITLTNLSNAQFKILNPFDKSVITNDTINVFGNPTNQITISFWVVNTGVGSVTLLSRRDSISLLLPDTTNDFCWGGLCYPNTTNVSSFSETIGAGDTSNTINTPYFYTHFTPYGRIGTSSIRYTFYNSSLHSDSNWVLVNYIITPAGISTVSDKSIIFSSPYPNPSGTSVNFNYSLSSGTQSANLKIFNLLGECIQTIPLNASKNKTSINVQAMPSGIYICQIAASGCQPICQKMIVSH